MLSIQKVSANQAYNTNFRGKRSKNQFSENKSNNGQFDTSEALKNFGKGAISPITAAIKHPLATAGLLAGTIAACAIIPVMAPIMLVGFGALSVGQLANGCYDAIKNYKNGDYDKAEKSFDTIGQGTIGTLFTLMGVKQCAQVTKEAKLMSELNTNTLNVEMKQNIKTIVNKNTLLENLKEISSLFTTKTGLKAVITQFKPTSVKNNIRNILNSFQKKETKIETKTTKYKTTEEKIKEFKASKEGIRRASLTDEQIENEVQAIYDKAFDKLEIPKKQRPVLKIEKGTEKQGGSYSQYRHTLEFNPESYKAGVFEMDNVIMHEATHCKETLLRAGIPQEKANAIVKQELLSRIINGEQEEILVKIQIINQDMMKPPKMSANMKSDFAKIAEKYLYTKDKNFIENLRTFESEKSYFIRKGTCNDFNALGKSEKGITPLLKEIRSLMDKYPDFVKNYSNSEEALLDLIRYSESHNVRYNYFSKVGIQIGENCVTDANYNIKFEPKYLEVEKLTGEQLAQAEKSLIDNISTIEGNARIGGLRGLFAGNKDFNQYQFSPEEVLAQKNGNEFVIDNLSAKIQEMKNAGSLTPEDEAYMTSIIEKARATIEYKTKGLEYYEKYTQMINHPEDKKLATIVQNIEKELDILKDKIDPETYETVTKIVKIYNNKNLPTIKIPEVAIYQMISKFKQD